MTEDVFPVICSTLASQALITRVLTQYEIGQVRNCQFWNRGLSDVYLVETSSRPYILRVSHHHWRSKSELDFELELLDFLRQHYLPVAYPLRTQQGEFSVEIQAPEGKRYASLFIYAPGQVALGDLNPTQSECLGEVVAKIHQVTLAFKTHHQRQALTLEYLIDDSLEAIRPLFYHRPADLADLREIGEQIKQKLENFPQEPPFWVICWGDPHSGNAHFTRTDKVTLFDFDQCGYGWRIFDIAKFWQISLRTGISRTVREAFLKGYQSVQALTELEFNALQSFTQTAHLWMWMISCTAAKLHDYSKLDDTYLTLRLEQLKRLHGHDWQLF
jgi:Ser/Thr protein kinase RdoA (MazF antagonist)